VRDVKLVSIGYFYQYLQENENKTQIGVIFCTSEWVLFKNMGVSIPCRFDELKNENKLIFYTIVFNWTLSFKSPFLQNLQSSWTKDMYAARLKISIDNGIANYFANTGH
jgi:hypothetical protein